MPKLSVAVIKIINLRLIFSLVDNLQFLFKNVNSLLIHSNKSDNKMIRHFCVLLEKY